MDPDFDDTRPSAKLERGRSLWPDLDDTVASARNTVHVPELAVSLDTVPLPSVPLPATTPALYGFRVGPHGPIVPLEIAVLLGRRPSPPRITSGELPRLVSVPSPLQEVSGTHLEIRQLGSTVIVTDLKSTNGTVVFVPGQDSRTLRGGEAVVVTPGTLVDIGDGNVIEILPARRLEHVEGNE